MSLTPNVFISIHLSPCSLIRVVTATCSRSLYSVFSELPFSAGQAHHRKDKKLFWRVLLACRNRYRNGMTSIVK